MTPLHRPGRLDATFVVKLVVATIGLRAVFVIGHVLLFGGDLPTFARYGDGESYIEYARLLAGLRDGLDVYDRRVFPGYPLLMAVPLLVGVPAWLAGLLISWAAAAAVTVLGAIVFRSRAVGWLLAFFPPIHLACTSAVANEGPMLALLLGGVLAGMTATRAGGWRWAVVAGLLLGAAGVVRPMACFGAAGVLVFLLMTGRPRQAVVAGVLSLLVVFGGLLVVRLALGDPLEGVRVYTQDERAYDGEPLAWPGKSLLTTPLRQPVMPAKVVYNWLHVGATSAALGVLAWLVLTRRGPSRAWATAGLVWAGGNFLFVLCVGSDWGFHVLPRLLIPGLPPTLWAWTVLVAAMWGSRRRPPVWAWTLLAAAGSAVSLAVALFQARAR